MFSIREYILFIFILFTDEKFPQIGMLNKQTKKGKPEHSRSRIDCENTLEKHSLPGFGYARKASNGFPYSDSPELIGPLS